MELSVAERASQAHGILRKSGAVPSHLLPADIYDSWMRCVALGLDSTRPPPVNMASPSVLRSEQEQRVLLRGLALAEMQTLHDQIAGSNFLIAFATPMGSCSTSWRTRVSPIRPRPRISVPAPYGLRRVVERMASARSRSSSVP